MNPVIQAQEIIPLFLVALTWFTLSPNSRAVSPPPDGGYPNQNTAEDHDALFGDTTGSQNTATGVNALFSNTTGFQNTANGVHALLSNTTGSINTAVEVFAIAQNSTGRENTAIGFGALDGNVALRALIKFIETKQSALHS